MTSLNGRLLPGSRDLPYPALHEVNMPHYLGSHNPALTSRSQPCPRAAVTVNIVQSLKMDHQQQTANVQPCHRSPGCARAESDHSGGISQQLKKSLPGPATFAALAITECRSTSSSGAAAALAGAATVSAGASATCFREGKPCDFLLVTVCVLPPVMGQPFRRSAHPGSSAPDRLPNLLVYEK